jgi:DNA-binding transcriptional LysR family regulator
MTKNLDDLYYFSGVVANGGSAAASRALKLPTATLSRRVSELEERLGVRFIERTTRRL